MVGGDRLDVISADPTAPHQGDTDAAISDWVDGMKH
jgi:hypothetical protein